MSIESLKSMKTQLINCVQGQIGNLKEVDAKQLGQAVDMIKDLSEAIYYCTITEAMEKTEDKENLPVNNVNYYTMPMPSENYSLDYLLRDNDRRNGYMYYPSGNGSSSAGGNTSSNSGGNRGSSSYYTEPMYNNMYNNRMNNMPMPRDPREGTAALRRRMYMEGKENHNDPNSQLKELEAYLQELSSDITEMIKGASPEEKATLHQKMTMLANKMA